MIGLSCHTLQHVLKLLAEMKTSQNTSHYFALSSDVFISNQACLNCNDLIVRNIYSLILKVILVFWESVVTVDFFSLLPAACVAR
jgi:hypothetical protein